MCYSTCEIPQCLRAHWHARRYPLSADCGRGRGYVPIADSRRGFQHAGANIRRQYPRGYWSGRAKMVRV
jgi:hypothetical protein